MPTLQYGAGHLHRRQVEIVDGAILEASLARDQVVPAFALHRGNGDRAAGKPGPVQFRQRAAPGDQAADAGRIAKNLVEGERHKVGLDSAQVEPVGRREGRAVEQYIPALRLCVRHPFQRMLHAAEVGLGRKSQQVGGRRISLGRCAAKSAGSTRRSALRSGM